MYQFLLKSEPSPVKVVSFFQDMIITNLTLIHKFPNVTLSDLRITLIEEIDIGIVGHMIQFEKNEQTRRPPFILTYQCGPGFFSILGYATKYRKKLDAHVTITLQWLSVTFTVSLKTVC